MLVTLLRSKPFRVSELVFDSLRFPPIMSDSSMDYLTWLPVYLKQLGAEALQFSRGECACASCISHFFTLHHFCLKNATLTYWLGQVHSIDSLLRLWNSKLLPVWHSLFFIMVMVDSTCFLFGASVTHLSQVRSRIASHFRLSFKDSSVASC